MKRQIKIAIAEDHLIFRQGMIKMLEDYDDIKVIFHVSNGKELLDELKKLTPDIILLDIGMPIMPGNVAMEKIVIKYPKIKMTLDNSDEVITPGSKCEAIVQCSGIWVVGDSFGISWSVVQIKAYKNNNAIVGYAFQDEEQEETTY